MMRYWFDTEFHDDGHHIALISIGVVLSDEYERPVVRINKFLILKVKLLA
jgi:hypothetical protein